MNQGSLSFSSTTGSIAVPVALAINGLSENPVGTIVLGQDLAQAGNPAALLNDREIPLLTFLFYFLGTDYGNGTENINFQTGGVEIRGDAANNSNIFAPSLTLTELSRNVQGFLVLSPDGVNPEMWTILSNGVGNIKIHETTGQVTITTNFAEQPNLLYFFNVTGNSRLNGWTVTQRQTFANNAALPISVQSDANRSIYTNRGAGADGNWNLPAVGDGQDFYFLVEDAFFLRVTPFGTDQIIFGSTVGAAGAPIVSATPGSTLHLMSVGARWFVFSSVGPWVL